MCTHFTWLFIRYSDWIFFLQEVCVVEHHLGDLGVWALGEHIQASWNKTKQIQCAQVKRVCLWIITWILNTATLLGKSAFWFVKDLSFVLLPFLDPGIIKPLRTSRSRVSKEGSPAAGNQKSVIGVALIEDETLPGETKRTFTCKFFPFVETVLSTGRKKTNFKWDVFLLLTNRCI